MKARVVGFFPGKVGFARVFPVSHCLPPQNQNHCKAATASHAEGSLAVGFSRCLPHSSSTARFDLLFPRFIILFAISASFHHLHPSQPYSQLRLCLPVKEMPSYQLKSSLDWMLLAPTSLKPGYPQVRCWTAADGSSSKAPRPSITPSSYSSACPGNISVQTVL